MKKMAVVLLAIIAIAVAVVLAITLQNQQRKNSRLGVKSAVFTGFDDQVGSEAQSEVDNLNGDRIRALQNDGTFSN